MTTTRGLLIAIFVALLAICQVWMVTGGGGQLRGGVEIEEEANNNEGPDATPEQMERELAQLDHLERFLKRVLTEEQLHELTEEQRLKMMDMTTDQERELFIYECFGDKPSATPTAAPSLQPSISIQPSISRQPSASPSQWPSWQPSVSTAPSLAPSVSQEPSAWPSSAPPSSSPTSNCIFAYGKHHGYFGSTVARVGRFFGLQQPGGEQNNPDNAEGV